MVWPNDVSSCSSSDELGEAWQRLDSLDLADSRQPEAVGHNRPVRQPRRRPFLGLGRPQVRLSRSEDDILGNQEAVGEDAVT